MEDRTPGPAARNYERLALPGRGPGHTPSGQIAPAAAAAHLRCLTEQIAAAQSGAGFPSTTERPGIIEARRTAQAVIDRIKALSTVLEIAASEAEAAASEPDLAIALAGLSDAWAEISSARTEQQRLGSLVEPLREALRQTEADTLRSGGFEDTYDITDAISNLSQENRRDARALLGLGAVLHRDRIEARERTIAGLRSDLETVQSAAILRDDLRNALDDWPTQQSFSRLLSTAASIGTKLAVSSGASYPSEPTALEPETRRALVDRFLERRIQPLLTTGLSHRVEEPERLLEQLRQNLCHPAHGCLTIDGCDPNTADDLLRKGQAFTAELEQSAAMLCAGAKIAAHLDMRLELEAIDRILRAGPYIPNRFDLSDALRELSSGRSTYPIPTAAEIGLVREVLVERGILGPEVVPHLDRVLGTHVRSWLIEQRDRDDRSAARGRDTLTSYDPELVPYIILNGLRLRGYQCEHPLLIEGPGDTPPPLQEYLTRMPADARAQAGERWGPELNRLIAGLEHAFEHETPRERLSSYRGGTGSMIITAVKAEGAALACHLLEESASPLDVVPIEVLKRLQWTPQPGQQQALVALAGRVLHTQPGEADGIELLMLDRGTTGAGRVMAETLLSRVDDAVDIPGNAMVHGAVLAALGSWDRSPTPVELHALGEQIGERPERVRNLISFLSGLHELERLAPLQLVTPAHLITLTSSAKTGVEDLRRLVTFADRPAPLVVAELVLLLQRGQSGSGGPEQLDRFSTLADDLDGIRRLAQFAAIHPDQHRPLWSALNTGEGQARVLSELANGEPALRNWLTRFEEYERHAETLRRTLGWSSVPQPSDADSLMARATPEIISILALPHPDRFKLCVAPRLASLNVALLSEGTLRRAMPADHPLVRSETPARLLITHLHEIPKIAAPLLADRLRSPRLISVQESEDLLACLSICNALPREHPLGAHLTAASAAGTELGELRSIAVSAAVQALERDFPADLLERYNNTHPEGLAPFIDVLLHYHRSLTRFGAEQKVGILKAVALIELRDDWTAIRAGDSEAYAALRAQIEHSFVDRSERQVALSYLTAAEEDPGPAPELRHRFEKSFAPASYVVREHALEDDLTLLEHSLDALFKGGHLPPAVCRVLGITGDTPDARLLATRWKAAERLKLSGAPRVEDPVEAAVHAEIEARPEESRAARIEGLQQDIEAAQNTARTGRLFRILASNSREELARFQDALAAQRERLLTHREAMQELGISGDRSFGLRIRRAELARLRLRIEEALAAPETAAGPAHTALLATVHETESVLQGGIKLIHTIAKRAAQARDELARLHETVEEIAVREERGEERSSTLAWASQRYPGLEGFLRGKTVSRDTLSPLIATTALDDLTRLSVLDESSLLAGPRSVTFSGETSFVAIQRALVGQCLDYRSHRNSVGNSIHTLSYQDPDRRVIIGHDASKEQCLNGLVFLTHLTSSGYSGPVVVIDKAYIPNGQAVSGDLERALFRYVADQSRQVGVPVFIPSANTQANLHFTDMEVMAAEVGAQAFVTEGTVLVNVGPSGSTYSEIDGFEAYQRNTDVSCRGYLIAPLAHPPIS